MPKREPYSKGSIKRGSMTIKKRIIISSITLFALLTTLGVVNWLGNRAVLYKTSNAYLFKDGTMHLQGIFRGINEYIIDEGEPISVALIEENLKGFAEVYSTLNERLREKDLIEAMTVRIGPQWEIVREGTKSFVKDNPWISSEDDAAMLQYGKLTTEARTLHTEVEALSDIAQEKAAKVAKKAELIINAIAFVILVIIFLILVNIFRSINSPIKELKKIAENFSCVNFSMLMDDSRKDEFGMVSSDFNKATEKLNVILSNVKNITEVLSLRSEEISSSAIQLASNAKEQSSQTTRAVKTLEDLTASFTGVANNTTDTAASAKNAADLSLESADVITGTVTGMNNIAQSVSDSAVNIEALDSGSKQIGEIIKVINDIAGQTNLLALNAAIEAARAGEQGRGFAVVADEVRKLAEKTTSSTSEVGDMIKGIQDNTAKTVSSLTEWRKEVESSLELANKAGNALQMIVVAVDNVTHKSQEIAASADGQARTGEIVISDIESISNLARQAAENAQDSSNATRDMNVLVQKLHNLINEFKLRGETAESESDIIEECDIQTAAVQQEPPQDQAF